MKKELISFCIAKKLEALRAKIHYYQTAFLPEIRDYTGSSQSEHLERAKKALEEFKIAINDYKESGQESYLNLSENEKANYIRVYAIEQREQARNWADSNIFIKWRSLRNAVIATNELKGMLPQLNIYSNHWLCSRTKISL